jgi:transposase
MIAELIWRKFQIGLSKASVCRLLNQLGLTPQRPLWRAFQQDSERVEEWIKVEAGKILNSIP